MRVWRQAADHAKLLSFEMSHASRAKIVGCKLGELTNPTGVHPSMVKKSVAAIVLQWTVRNSFQAIPLRWSGTESGPASRKMTQWCHGRPSRRLATRVTCNSLAVILRVKTSHAVEWRTGERRLRGGLPACGHEVGYCRGWWPPASGASNRVGTARVQFRGAYSWRWSSKSPCCAIRPPDGRRTNNSFCPHKMGLSGFSVRLLSISSRPPSK